MDIKDIYEVWDRFEKSSLSELKLSLGGDNLELKKAMEAISTEDKSGKIKQQVITKNDFMEENEPNEGDSDYKEIKAPFVGTLPPLRLSLMCQLVMW